jgi:hypothetical protein
MHVIDPIRSGKQDRRNKEAISSANGIRGGATVISRFPTPGSYF